jgi:hypothetical protein
MLIRRSLLAMSLISLAFAAGCTTTSEGDPLPASSTSSDSPENGEEELPFGGAPKVADPLDTSRYEHDPCQSLTGDQAESLDLPAAGTVEEVPLSTACDWRNTETRGEVEIVFFVDDPRGLSPEYKNRKKYAFFEVLPNIEGYPAVARDDPDDRKIGHCAVVVGVADDMALEVILRLSQRNVETKDPCAEAARVASLALQTMKKED